jgi:hypothetical protein
METYIKITATRSDRLKYVTTTLKDIEDSPEAREHRK